MKAIQKHLLIFLASMLIYGGACSAHAEVDMDELLAKIEKLQQENEELRDQQRRDSRKFSEELEEVKKVLVELRGKPLETCGKKEREDYFPPAVSCKEPIKLYGFFKGDMIYNDSQVGEWGAAAPSEGGGDDNEFLMAVRWSRLGIKVNGPELPGGGKLDARVEADFVNVNPSQGDADRHPSFRLFQAYANLEYKDWGILAGQAWDFFSPFDPNMINAAWLERGGNIGYRHPVLRFTYRFRDVAGGTLTTQAGVIDTTLLQNDTGYPITAGYAYYENEIMGLPYYLGAGAIYGQQRISNNITGYVDLWAATMAFRLQANDKLYFKGEGFIGQALQDFWGGSTASVITYPDGTGKAVPSRGGWVQATYMPVKKVEINCGAGIDDVVLAENPNIPLSVWDYNYSLFTNFKYELAADLWWAIEYQYFKTKYLEQPSGDANRLQSSVIYRF
jgi:hypothetical protein